MYNFQQIGSSSIRFLGSIRIFFWFLGHLVVSIIHVLAGSFSVYWLTMGKTIFRSGVLLMFPIIIISALMGLTLSLSLFDILSRFQIQHNALPITQNIMLHNLLPLIIGVILSIQSGLNLINAQVKRLHRMPQEVILEYIIPMMAGIIITGLLLYVYALTAFLIGIYSTFHYILNINTQEYLWHITNTLALADLGYSIFKNLLYCSIVALVAGYYYYEIAIRNVSLRKAVSSIMTRSLLWIIILGTYLGIYST
ncbi:ABC transporter permease [Legionella israelensis]|uniref:ABC transporter permease n=1 Tax=Legionella israelensis TaxID=454 RepID=A0AAX1EHZ4_9GAMM|nr:ABC transporter permease [Legionella israelensis]